MNILYICADWGIPIQGFKGGSVHVREFVNMLHRLGHEVTLAFAARGSGNPSPNATLIELAPESDKIRRQREAERIGILLRDKDQTLDRELDKLAYDRRFAERVLASLRESGRRPDVVYERYALFHKGGAEIAQALRVPYVLEINAPLIEEQERFRGLMLKNIAAAAEQEIFRRADHFIVVSEAIRNGLIGRGVAPSRVTCLPNGVDTSRFHPGVDGTIVRARYALDSRPVMGFSGSLKPWHGLDFLLDAFAAVGQASDAAMLLIVGEGPGLSHVRERAAHPRLRNRVIVTGGVPHGDVPAHLAAMDLTVAPYVAQEGFYFSPLKVLESMAVGRPVVAPRLGQLVDLIEDGSTGALYPPGDLDACATRLAGLLADAPARAAMGRRAAAVAARNFSWKKTVQQATAIMAAARDSLR